VSLAVRGTGERATERPLTPHEAAEYLRTSVRALYRLPIPCHVLSPRRRLYSRSILDRYLEECISDPEKTRAAS
jgi:hypothetical protein